MTTVTSESTTEQLPDHLSECFDALIERIETLEAELEAKDERITELEQDRDRLRERTATLEAQLEDGAAATTDVESLAEAALKKANTNKERVTELQARELEKGAHLRTDTVDAPAVEVAGGQLERFSKDDGHQYYRLPESADPLDRDGTVALAYGDLLPIQQLARMDEEMRRSATTALPTRLAAKLWQARTDGSVGDNPWQNGCEATGINEYVKAGDLKHWIRRQRSGISDSYAKKLVSRTIDAMLDLSKHRLAVRRQQERKNGLEYTERRLVVPVDASIPGESGSNGEAESSPETGDVHG